MEPPLGQLPLADFASNHVIEKFIQAGHTYYTLYAHMKPGSVRMHVHLGEHLRLGEQVGALGNSGNSTAPHLHFQVMDRLANSPHKASRTSSTAFSCGAVPPPKASSPTSSQGAPSPRPQASGP